MTISAIYRNGVFEPLERVELEENSAVQLAVVGCASDSGTSPQTGWRRFSLGLLAPPGPDFKELGPEWKEYVE